MTAPSRPALRWHGGKWLLAPWILEHFPPHHVYVEPFGGGASVLLRKRRCHAEVYNDLDDEAVNLFRVLRDADQSARLIALLERTPFGRAEFEAAYEVAGDPIERARRLVIRSFMGHGGASAVCDHRSGFRANSNRSGSTPAADWMKYPSCLDAIYTRLRGVIIEHRDARTCMAQHDSAVTLHYVDPPYMAETRSGKGGRPDQVYRHELSDDDHRDLLSLLRGLKGMVLLSGYGAPVYDDALRDWHRVERAALADGAKPRVEVLWINPAGAARLPSPTLLDGVA